MIVLTTATAANGLRAMVDGPSGHDALDAAMFWVGLLFVLTPLTIISAVAGYLWWRRKHPPAADDAAIAASDRTLPR